MNVSTFRKVLEEFQEGESALLDIKRTEYASEDGDVLENFKTLGQLLHLQPSQIAVILLAKHIQGVTKQVMDRKFLWAWVDSEGEGTAEGLKQRIADARNYLTLLAACIEEEATNAPENADRPG